MNFYDLFGEPFAAVLVLLVVAGVGVAIYLFGRTCISSSEKKKTSVSQPSGGQSSAFCTICGNQIADGAAFCGKCGNAASDSSNQTLPIKGSLIKDNSYPAAIIVGTVIIIVMLILFFFSPAWFKKHAELERNWEYQKSRMMINAEDLAGLD